MARKTPKYGNWVKNFGSSVKFASKDVLTELAPSIAGTTSGMAADVRELKQTIRKLRKDKRAIVNYIIGEDENVSKYAGEALKNLKHGLKTGDMYDPARSEKMLMKSMGLDDLMDGFDDNSDDFNFDESDVGSEDISSVDFGPAKVFAATGAANIKALGGLNTSINNGTATMAKGFSELDKSNKKSMAISIALNEKFFNNTAEKLDAVNNNLVTMVEFNNQTMSTFVQGSLKYYDDSLAVMNGMLSALNRLAPERTKKETPGYEGALDQMMNGDGFSLMGYAKTVAKNAKNSFQDSPISLLTMFNNPMFMADFAANPMGMLMGEGIKQLIPSSVKKSMKDLDKHFKSFIPALLNKVAGYEDSDNPLLSMFGQLFGVKSKGIGSKYNSANYEHGAIVWDGEAKKALTEVIPSYLSLINYNIEKIINKKSARQVIWDSSAGKFTTMERARSKETTHERDAALSGMSEISWSLNQGINKMGDSKSREAYQKAMGDVLYGLVVGNHNYRPHSKESDDFVHKLLGNKKGINPKAIVALLNALPPDLLMELNTSAVYSGRDALNRYRAENFGGSGANTSVMNLLHNNVFNPEAEDDKKEWIDKEFGIYKDDAGHPAFAPGYEAMAHQKLGKSYRFNSPKSALRAIATYRKKHPTNAGTGLTDVQVNTQLASNPDAMEKEFRSAMDANRWGGDDDDDNKVSSLIGSMRPADWINKGIGHLDRMMYEIIFGTKDNPSVFSEILTGIKNTFKTTKDWLINSIFKPIKIALFGEDIAKSKWFQDLTQSMSDAVVGTKDKDGKYTGGIFSAVRNMFTDLFATVKDQWKTYMVPMFNDMGDILRQYIFGEDKEKDKKNGKPKLSIMDKLMATLQEGFGSWSDILFGGGNGRGKNAKRSGALAAQQFKEAIPSTVRGGLVGATVGTISGFGGFGLLGSLFMPGGPIGGAIVGSVISLLHRSEAFKDMLYGKEDKETGERSGGIITKNTQSFFKKHKIPLIGGAMTGTASYALTGSMGFGIIPGIAISAFGPVLMGAAWGYALHADAIKNALFGKKDKQTGERTGAIISKSTQSFMRKSFPRAVVGALGSMAGFGVIGQLGIIGSMAALGPIPAALMGAGLGIASASTAFTRRFFGYYDEKTGEYHSGALDRVKNFFEFKLFKPLGLKIEKELFGATTWLKKNVAYPIADAFVPIKVLMKKTGHEIYDYVHDIFTKIGKDFNAIFTVIMKRVNTVFKIILTPLEKMANGALNMFKSVTGGLIKGALMPLTILGNLASMTIKGQAYQGAVGKAYGKLKDSLNTEGIGGIAKAAWHFGGSLIDTDAAMKNDKWAKEITDHEAEAAKRDADLEQQTGFKKSYFQEQQDKLKKAQEEFARTGWDNTSEMNRAKAERIRINRNAAIQAEIAANSNKPELNIAGQQLEQAVRANSKLDQLIDNTKILNPNTTKINGSNTPGGSGNENKTKWTIGSDGTLTKTGANYGSESEDEKLFKTAFKLEHEQEEMQYGAKKDDNLLTAVANKSKNAIEAKKEHREDEQLQVSKGILDALKPKKQSAFTRGFHTIFDLLGGVFSIGQTFVGIAGLIAAGVVALSLLFGDKRDGKDNARMLDHTTAGYAAKDILHIAARKILGPAAKIAMATGQGIYTGAKNVYHYGKDTIGALKETRVGKAFAQTSLGKRLSESIAGGATHYGAVKKGISSGVRKLTSPVTNAAKSIKNSIINKMEKVGAKSTFGLSAESRKLLNLNVEGAQVPKGLKKTFFDAISRLTESDGILGNFLKKSKSAATILSNISMDFREIASIILKPKNFKKIAETYGEKAATAGARTAASGFTLGVSDLVFGAYDAVTGAYGASEMFDVADQDVTLGMRAVAAAVNIFFGAWPMRWWDLGLSFLCMAGNLVQTKFGKVLSAMGVDVSKPFDHHKLVAQYLYKMISDDEDNENLDTKQANFKQEYEKYLNDNKLTPDQMSMDEYRNKKSPGIYQKYFEPIVRRVVGVEPKDGKNQSLMDRIKSPMDSFVKWFTDLIDDVVKLPLTPAGFFKDLIKGLFGWDQDAENKKRTNGKGSTAYSIGEQIHQKASSTMKWLGDKLDWIRNHNPFASDEDTAGSGMAGGGDNDEQEPSLLDRAKSGFKSLYNSGKELINNIRYTSPSGVTYDDNGNATNTSSSNPNAGDDSQNDEDNSPSIPGDNGDYAKLSSDTGDHRVWLYKQTDPDFANKPIAPRVPETSQFTMGQYGCAPTSMAMVVSRLKGKWVDPIHTSYVATDADVERGDNNTTPGMKPSFFERVADAYGLGYNQITDQSGSAADAINLLQKGYPLIFGGYGSSSSHQTPFTEGGHYVLANDVNLKGNDYDHAKVQIYDPMGLKSGEYNMIDVMNGSIRNGGYIGAFSMDSSDSPEQEDRAKAKRNAKKGKKIDGKIIVKRARDYIGTKYDLSGHGGAPGIPTSCAKFVTDVFKDCGVNLANNSSYVPDVFQFYSLKKAVAPADTKPEAGDVVIWDRDTESGGQGGSCAHIGICTGEGRGVIHAGSSTGVIEKEDYTTCMGSDFHVNCICKLSGLDGTAKYGGAGKDSKKYEGLMGWLQYAKDTFLKATEATLSGEKFVPIPLNEQKKNDTPASTSGASANENELGGGNLDPKDAYKFYKSKGYDDVAIAGILGNMQQENNFKSNNSPIKYINGVECGGMGLFQWSPSGGRREAIIAKAEEEGKNVEDPTFQMEYMMSEAPGRSVMPNDLNGIKDPGEAATLFNKRFEVGEQGRRSEFANAFYKKIQNGDFAAAGNVKPRYRKRAIAGAGNVNPFTGGMTSLLSAVKDYSNTYGANPLTSNPLGLATRVLANPSIRGLGSGLLSGAASFGIGDLIDPLTKLDTHDELQQIIAYLKIIAANDPRIKLNNDYQTNASIDRASRIARQNTQGRPANFEKAEQLMNTHSELADTLSGDWNQAYQMAIRKKYK